MKMVPALIGITGKAGSGKDTVGEYLDQAYCYERISFAGPLRKAIAAMFNLPSTHFQHPLKEVALPNIGKSPRQLMQTLGTEWGRELVHPDLWLILAKTQIESLHHAGRPVVITDVRFENEARMIRELCGRVWHVKRDGAGTPHQHASEAGIAFEAGSDTVIDNNKSLDELYELIDKVLA